MSAQSSTQRHPRFGVTKPRLVGVMLGTVLLSISLASPALAQWGKEITLNGTVTAKPLPAAEIASVTTRDSLVQNHNFQTTEAVSVRYPTTDGTTSEGPGEVKLLVRALPNSGLQQQMSVSVWPVTSDAQCTATSAPEENSVVGPWVENVLSEAVQIVPGGVATFCVRGYPTVSSPRTDQFSPEQNRPATVAAVATVNTGSQTFTQPAEYQAQLFSNGGSADSAVTSSPSVIATERIFPIENIDRSFRYVRTPNSRSPACWFIYGSTDPNITSVGSIAGIYSCGAKSARNQFQRIAQTGTGAVQIRMNDSDPQKGFMSVEGANSSIQTANQDGNDSRQFWIPQRLPEGGTQLVNVFSGQCILNAQYSYRATLARNCSSDPNEVPHFLTVWR